MFSPVICLSPPSETGERRVTFRYDNPAAKTVLILGTFTDWKPQLVPADKHGGWITRRDLPLNRQVKYSFIVDGKTIGDASKKNPPVSDGHGGEKTVYVIKPAKDKHQADDETGVGQKKTASSQPADAAEETAAPAEAAVVAVVAVVAAAPEPSPSAHAAPAVIDLATISKSPPAQWPKSVLLKKAAMFPAVLDGKIVGEVQVPVGTAVNVSLVQANGVTTEFRGAKKVRPDGATDLIERFRAANPR